jgi:transposase-like protein
VSKDTVSRITDRVVEDMQAWSARPLQAIYTAIFIDAIYVKDAWFDGRSGGQPTVLRRHRGSTWGGHRDVFGRWAGRGGGESAKFS